MACPVPAAIDKTRLGTLPIKEKTFSTWRERREADRRVARTAPPESCQKRGKRRKTRCRLLNGREKKKALGVRMILLVSGGCEVDSRRGEGEEKRLINKLFGSFIARKEKEGKKDLPVFEEFGNGKNRRLHLERKKQRAAGRQRIPRRGKRGTQELGPSLWHTATSRWRSSSKEKEEGQIADDRGPCTKSIASRTSRRDV